MHTQVPFEVVEAVDAMLIAQRFQMAATALITYDFFLTFSSEVRLVWYGHWRIPSIIFMLNRYGVLAYALISSTFLNGAVTSIQAIPPSEAVMTLFFCEFWSNLGGWSIPIITLLVDVMLVMRVVAMCGKAKAITIFLWGVYACCGIASIVVIVLEVQTTRITPTEIAHMSCDLEGNTRITWALWVPGLVMETTLVLVTGIRSFQYNWNGVSIPLLSLITRDGFMYFFSVFMLMLANLIICLTPSFIRYTMLVELALCLSSVLGTRLFLNLRRTAAEEKEKARLSAVVVPVRGSMVSV